MSVRKHPTSGRWVSDTTTFVNDKKHREQLQFNTKKQAEAHHAKVTMLNGKYVPDRATITVREAGERWLAAHPHLEKSTLDQYRGHLKYHVNPFIGQTKLSRITVPFVVNLLRRLKDEKRSLSMVRNVRVSLGAMFANAMAEGLMVSNPVRDMPRDNTNPERHKVRPKVGQDIPTRDEVKLILNHAREGRAKMFLRISALCGTRASETRGLTWGAVHLERGEIEIFARADASGKLGSPKTGNSRRSIPIGPRLIQELREFKLLLGRPKDSDYLFASKHGNVMNHANIIKDWWHPAQMQAFGSVRYSGLHALRHFYASHCINPKPEGLGLPQKLVQARMGHSSIVVTMDVYGHLFPSDGSSAELAAAEAALF